MRTHLLMATAVAAALLAATTSARAQTSWTGNSDSNWFNGGNWTLGVPTGATIATIDTVTPNATVVGTAGATAQNVTVGNFGTGALTIANGGTLSSISIFGSSVIGSAAGSQGTVTVTGAGSTWTNSTAPPFSLSVGNFGTGTLTIANGGTVNTSSGTIGSNPGSQGTVTVTGAGSTWTNSTAPLLLTVGLAGTGALTIANGGRVSSFGGGLGIRCRVAGYGDRDRRGLHLDQQRNRIRRRQSARARSRSRTAGP